MIAIDLSKKLPKMITPVFKDVAWQDWAALDPAALKKDDVDDGAQWQSAGTVPAGWIITQLGMGEFELGGIRITGDNNTVTSDDKATVDQLVQLLSYVKMQARDRIGLTLHESVDFKNI